MSFSKNIKKKRQKFDWEKILHYACDRRLAWNSVQLGPAVASVSLVPKLFLYFPIWASCNKCPLQQKMSLNYMIAWIVQKKVLNSPSGRHSNFCTILPSMNNFSVSGTMSSELPIAVKKKLSSHNTFIHLLTSIPLYKKSIMVLLH